MLEAVPAGALRRGALRFERHAWMLFAGASAIGIAAYFTLLRPESPQQSVLYNTLGLATVAAIVVGMGRHRPERSLVFGLFAAGQLALVAGDLIFNSYEQVLGVEAPFPSLADVFYLAGPPLIVSGLIVLIRARHPGSGRETLLDAAIVAAGFGLLSWVFLMAPYARDAELTQPERLVSIAYPLMDVLMLAVSARLLVTRGGRTPSFVLLASSLVAFLVADVGYAFMTIQGTYYSGAWIDAGWLISYALFGAAALHPSMKTLSAPARDRGPQLARRRFLLVAAATSTVPIALLYETSLGDTGEALAIGIGAALISALVLSRMRGLLRDVAASRRDPMTGLLNRDALIEELREAGSLLARGRPSTLLYLDLDNFSTVNESIGRRAADELLADVARLLHGSVGDDGLVVRIEGDAYAVLVPADLRRAQPLAEDLRRAVGDVRRGEPGDEIDLGCSIGVAAVDRGVAPETVLMHADAACAEAKARGRNLVEVYRPGLADAAEAGDAQWSPRIKDALRQGGLTLAFQPIIDTDTCAVSHHEALVRMTRPDGEPIEAGAFIGSAERTGLIRDLDRWVIGAAFERVARAQYAGGDLRLTINLSSPTLHDPSTVGYILSELASHGVDADRITFEITESVAVANLAATRRTIGVLRDMGCHFALDDFGKGFSSFAYLRYLPVEVLKIDRAFVREIAADVVDQALVRSIAELARALGMRTVAEGVEDAEGLAALRTIGVDMAQGYHIGRPAAEPLARAGTPATAGVA